MTTIIREMSPSSMDGSKRPRSNSQDMMIMPVPIKNMRAEKEDKPVDLSAIEELVTPREVEVQESMNVSFDVEQLTAQDIKEEKNQTKALPRSDSKFDNTLDSEFEEEDFAITWAVANEKGYRNLGFATRQPIHPDMEDVHWPCEADYIASRNPETTKETRPAIEHRHPISKKPITVFVLTDGHGGAEAPRFFVPRMREAIFEVMDSKDWDFEDEDEREAFDGLVGDVFEMLDKEYCEHKIRQYRVWIEEHRSEPEKRPVDDGCTMIVNVMYNKWLINCNVGDSRTVLAFRSKLEDGTYSEYIPCFSSNDHNMTHPEKIYDIHNAGGHFVNSNGTVRYNVNVQHAAIRNYRPYDELNGARLFRPSNENIRRIGVSHKRTLNLTCTMGDLLFKVEPAVMRAKPDVSFIRLDETKDYMLVIATDGLWDHLRYQAHASQQNEAVIGYISDSMDSWIPTDYEESDSSDGYDTDNELANLNKGAQLRDQPQPSRAMMQRVCEPTKFKLWRIAKSLTRREGAHHDLFMPRQSRVDDCTVFCVSIMGTQNN